MSLRLESTRSITISYICRVNDESFNNEIEYQIGDCPILIAKTWFLWRNMIGSAHGDFQDYSGKRMLNGYECYSMLNPISEIDSEFGRRHHFTVRDFENIIFYHRNMKTNALINKLAKHDRYSTSSGCFINKSLFMRFKKK